MKNVEAAKRRANLWDRHAEMNSKYQIELHEFQYFRTNENKCSIGRCLFFVTLSPSIGRGRRHRLRTAEPDRRSPLHRFDHLHTVFPLVIHSADLIDSKYCNMYNISTFRISWNCKEKKKKRKKKTLWNVVPSGERSASEEDGGEEMKKRQEKERRRSSIERWMRW